ncbi:MAG: penicillin-binding transpeptidase domain-containing protein, partial [Oscillospiraceae bacterium]
RAFSAYNVGSIFKPVTAAAALSNGMTKDHSFCCTGKIDIFDNAFGCHKKSGHGVLDLIGAMANSCNPYFIDFSKDISPEKLLMTASDLSFGKRTELCKNFFSDSGNLPTLREISSPAGKANFAFGQGELTATPLQIAQMMSAIVSGGNSIKPTLVKGYFDGTKLIEQQRSYPIKAMEKSVADELVEELNYSVMEMQNQNAKSNFVTCGGKTGTAQTGIFKNDKEDLNGWFAGYCYDKKYKTSEKINEIPKYVIVVLSENCDSGNENASPIFREIVDRLLLC